MIFAPPDLPLSREALRLLEQLADAPWLALPPVALPDLHWKPGLEAPSGLVTATREALVLGLTSPSLHCGMGLALTDLQADFLTPERLDRLFADLADRLDPRHGEPPLDDAALDAVLQRGLPAWMEREERVTVTEEGMVSAPDDRTVDGKAILQVIPSWLRPIARREFGLVGRGNHFLELQVVEEVLDVETAAAWGVEQGQVVLMVHADSGHLGAILGRLFAHRRKNGRGGRWREWRAKAPYHLERSASLAGVLERVRLFWPGRWVPIPVGSETGHLCRYVLVAVANYATASRLAVWGKVAMALEGAGASGSLRVLCDVPHNGIWPEVVDGQTVWVHRHNAARVLLGRPALLPGCERTSSLLAVGDEGAGAALNSASHGAGHTALRLGRPLGREAIEARRYGYDSSPPDGVPLLSDGGLWAVAGTLAVHRIIRPVARLRPVATLKDRGIYNHRDADEYQRAPQDSVIAVSLW